MKQEEKSIIEESDDSKNESPIRLKKNYTQYHFKMLADVIEALIGAVFLDCFVLKHENKEDNSDEESKDSSRMHHKEFNYNHVAEAEDVWKRLVEKYLIYYADIPILPDIALFKSEVDKKPYCKHFKDNYQIEMTEFSYENIVKKCEEEFKHNGTYFIFKNTVVIR